MKLTVIISMLLIALGFSACDATDESLSYETQYFPIGEVSWQSGVTEAQKSVVADMLNHLVKVEPCQFFMGVQSYAVSRPNYVGGFSSYQDSVKSTTFVHADGTTSVVHSPYANQIHLLDKRIVRRAEAGEVMYDTIRFTVVYHQPEAKGVWVGPVTEISMNHEYYIGSYEVTQSQWQAVMGDKKPTGRYCKVPTTQRDSAWYHAIGKGDRVAAYNIWYEDALAFCARLNEMLNIPANAPMRFRLPTEAEWECAARGAKYSHGYRYPGSDTYMDVAWCNMNAGNDIGPGKPGYGVHEVGLLPPNELGLYDMAGNVSEWVLNKYYRYSYRDSVMPMATFNPPAELHPGCYGDTLVLRGGSWAQKNAYSFSVGARQDFERPVDNEKFMAAIPHCGFRIVYSIN